MGCKHRVLPEPPKLILVLLVLLVLVLLLALLLMVLVILLLLRVLQDPAAAASDLAEAQAVVDFLGRAWPRLQAWFNWYNTTQAGPEPHSYRWAGQGLGGGAEQRPQEQLVHGALDGVSSGWGVAWPPAVGQLGIMAPIPGWTVTMHHGHPNFRQSPPWAIATPQVAWPQ